MQDLVMMNHGDTVKFWTIPVNWNYFLHKEFFSSYFIYSVVWNWLWMWEYMCADRNFHILLEG